MCKVILLCFYNMTYAKRVLTPRIFYIWYSVIEYRTKCLALMYECWKYSIFYQTLSGARQLFWSLRSSSQGSEFETCWNEMIYPTKNILQVVCQHPKQKDKYFLKYLKKSLNKVARENKKVILTGDFNLNHQKFDTNTEVNDFLDLRTRNCFSPHILGPTRITSQDKPSLIDNIFF